MLRSIWIASIHIRQFMRLYMPTTILLNAIRTRRGLKWGVPAMLLLGVSRGDDVSVFPGDDGF